VNVGALVGDTVGEGDLVGVHVWDGEGVPVLMVTPGGKVAVISSVGVGSGVKVGRDDGVGGSVGRSVGEGEGGSVAGLQLGIAFRVIELGRPGWEMSLVYKGVRVLAEARRQQGSPSSSPFV